MRIHTFLSLFPQIHARNRRPNEREKNFLFRVLLFSVFFRPIGVLQESFTLPPARSLALSANKITIQRILPLLRFLPLPPLMLPPTNFLHSL